MLRAARHRADAFVGGDRKAAPSAAGRCWLAIGTFTLSLLGTFLVRSALTSVHAFVTDPEARSFHPRFWCW